MTNLYDVIIVGAGPSGTSCAYNLLRVQPRAKVLVVDKAIFPRYKPCGGGISPEIANYFDFSLDPVINYRCHDVAIRANAKQIHTNNYELWMVRREVFDDFLLAKARAQGADFYCDCEVQTLSNDKETATKLVYTSKGIFRTKVVVIAEGGLGKLAKTLGLAPKNTLLAAMEYEHYTPHGDGKLYIDFDYNASGYAWNFPKSDGLSLGIGGLVKGRAKLGLSLPKQLANYIKQFGVEKIVKGCLHGHPIQAYAGKHKLVQDKVMLIGEIAGCVDPLTAEGIRPAVKSGFLAAQAIANALLNNNLSQLDAYDQDFHRQIGRDLQRARLLSFFLNRYLAQILPLLATEKAVNGFMQVFSGQARYSDKINLTRIWQWMWKAWIK